MYPSEVALAGPNRTQQLLVVEEENGRAVRDVTALAKYSRPQGKGGPVVKVDEKGLITAIDGGDFKITITVDGKTVKVGGSVGSEAQGTPNFRNHVIPTFTRAGCNAGACHGAARRQGRDEAVAPRLRPGERLVRDDPAGGSPGASISPTPPIV